MTEERVAQAALDRALDEQQDLLLVYQPIHEARSRRIVAAEALLRQRRRNGEIREASIITEAAEQGPELFELNSLTMRTAFQDARRWMGFAPDIHLNVNLSPREFQEDNIVEKVSVLLSACSIEARQVSLEITETSYIDRPKETMHVLEELKALGVQLWLDDFGTGHSSITHLQHFPLDGLKLPKTFVSRIVEDRRCRAITTHIIALAHDLGLSVIAEGVEKDEELAILLEHGCEFVQGFLFSRPMTLPAFEETLRREVR